MDTSDAAWNILAGSAPRQSSPRGNPNCPDCHGQGHTIAQGRWRRCSCTRPTPDATKALRAANARDDLPQGRWLELLAGAGDDH